MKPKMLAWLTLPDGQRLTFVITDVRPGPKPSKRKRKLRTPKPPKALLQAVARAFFPKRELADGEWLAHVAKECGEDVGQRGLREILDSGNLDALRDVLRDYQREWNRIKDSKPVGLERLALIIAPHYDRIMESAATAPAVYKDLHLEEEGYDFDNFRRYLQRLGVQLAKPGRPKK